MRTACFTLMYHDDDNWKERFDEDIEIQKNNFQEIGITILEKLNVLYHDRVSNAYRALPIFLDKYWNNPDNGDLINQTISYIERNFDYTDEYNQPTFKIIVVLSSNVNYHSPDLFYYTKGDNRSVVVGHGLRMKWSKYNCDEDNEAEMKKLTCFKIGDSHINYHGDNVGFFDSPNNT